MQMTMTTSTKLAVIGTGALGSALLEKLSAHRFETVVLIDPDKLQKQNLALSPLLARAAAAFTNAAPTEAPACKAALLTQWVRQNSGLQWLAHCSEIADVGWQELQAVDLFCCCTDNTLSRIETAFLAHMLHKPVLDGAVFGDGIAEGRVSLFPADPAAACYLCGIAEDRRATLLGYAASTAMGCRLPDDPQAMTGTMATLQHVAQLMLERIDRFQDAALEQSEVTKAVFYGEDATGSTGTWHNETTTLTQSSGCPWHGPVTGTLVPMSWNRSIRETLQAGALVQELHLAWPICTGAACSGCGWRGTPLRRVAAVRRMGCPRCGQPGLEPVRSLHRIRATDPESALSPRQLGLPDRHLYWLHDTAV